MPTVLRVAAHVPRQNYVHHLLRPTMQRVLALQMPLEAIELVPTSHDVLHVHYCRIGMGPPAGGGRILANIRGHVSIYGATCHSGQCQTSHITYNECSARNVHSAPQGVSWHLSQKTDWSHWTQAHTQTAASLSTQARCTCDVDASPTCDIDADPLHWRPLKGSAA